MNNACKKYFGIALDPIHIGTGGYRLGSVDNTIVREPSTDVPKIPGTSLAGVIREFATLHLMESDDDCKNKTGEKDKRSCAEEKIKDHFGDDTRQGKFRFYDGQIFFFPVSSIQGTVWITTKELLEYWFGEIKNTNGEAITIAESIDGEAFAIKGIDSSMPTNLCWLLLSIKSVDKGNKIVLPPKLNEFIKRAVIVSDKLFSHIVNDNLEVRTSVKIDPQTGAASDKALFTYEAIPRGTVIGFEIATDSRQNDTGNIDSLIESTFPYLKLLGIGGLGTRGFGRVEVIDINK